MALNRFPLHKMFGILVVISALSLVFVVNFHEIIEKTAFEPRTTRDVAKYKAITVFVPLSDQEKALVGIYISKEDKDQEATNEGIEENAQAMNKQVVQVMKVYNPQIPQTTPPAKSLLTAVTTTTTSKSEAKKSATQIPNRLDIEWLNKSAKCLPLPRKVRVAPIPQEDCTQPHVVMHEGGQLGNKMCQYISLYLLRHIFGVRVSIPPRMREVLSRYFVNITIPSQDPECFTKNTLRITYDDLYKQLQARAVEKSRNGYALSKNTSSSDLSGVIREPLMDTSYYIYHHPCPRDVIMAHRDLVRRVLTFRDEVLRKAWTNLRGALHRIGWAHSLENTTVVTVHVRRRDYTAYISKHYNLTQLGEEYFRRAFQHFRERVMNPVFVVVSDDHSWCRATLESGDVVLVGDKKDPEADIALLSLGRHTIISYGTFSFMGATLARGDIAHPVNNNSLYNHYDCVDNPAIKPIYRDSDEPVHQK